MNERNTQNILRDGSRTAAISKMEHVVIIELCNNYHKELHLGCCSSPRFASNTVCSNLLKMKTSFL